MVEMTVAAEVSVVGKCELLHIKVNLQVTR